MVVKFIYTHARISLPQNALHLVPFHVLFAVLMLLGLHGASIIKIFTILILNFTIAKVCKGSKLGPISTWIFNLLVLYGNEVNHGYQFGHIHPSLEFLDAIKGIYPRWHISFNITMLRLVSFSTDYSWACNAEMTEDDGAGFTEKQRKATAHPLENYSLMNYISYVLYPPLYIAGPIITFNDFMWQLRKPLVIGKEKVLRYLFRFLVCFVTMEFVLHFMYMVAIKDTRAWQGDSPAEVGMIGFWNLIIVWLKLLLPWRFFRFWALMDGIDPPENMVRCMVNNYSAFGFWRSWHRSYNLWTIRYIYVPMGGSKNVILNSVLVFTFVALWHDLTFRLLAWGWLITLFILPEMVATYLLPSSKYGSATWYRHVCAIGAVINMFMMMSANLIGFVIGTDGIKYLLSQIFGTWEGISFRLLSCPPPHFIRVSIPHWSVCSNVGGRTTHVRVPVRSKRSTNDLTINKFLLCREEEMRRGIYRRC
jgi:D-alanyl-lipoteichoic acid acyltransferase DltB (MBOAT superfamily)